VVQAQFTFTTNGDNTITITGYTGSGGDVTIPDTITTMPVTGIGDGAFFTCSNLTSITIPISVNSIGNGAFYGCSSLTSLTIPNGVTTTGQRMFYFCTSLTNITLPDSLNNIGPETFNSCSSLPSITIPSGVTHIGSAAFIYCTNLTGIFFKGNAPWLDYPPFYLFEGDANAQIYHLPGTIGWDVFSSQTSIPNALWLPQIETTGNSFGVQPHQFGFTINWASGQTVVVEASTNLIGWQPLQTNMLTTGSAYFSDQHSTNFLCCYYRLRSP
jgi:hypothetical protein